MAFDGGSWIFSSTFARQAIAFGLNVLLARTLLVDDFALMAVVFSFVALIQVYSEVGISIAIIQKRDLTNADFDNAVYLSAIICLLSCLLIGIYASNISSYLNQPKFSEAVLFLYITVFSRGLFSVYRGFLLRNLRYKAIAVIETFSTICYALCAFIFLSSNPTITNLYIAHIISSLVLFVSAYLLVNRYPKSTFSLWRCKEILSVGIWVSINRILGQSSSHLDKFIVSASTTPVQLGGYYICQQLASMITNNLASAVEQTLLPLYSRIDGERLERGYWNAFKLYVALVTPIVVIPALQAEQIITFIYGDRWDEFSEVFQILCLGAFFGALGGGIFGSIFYSQGMTKPVALVGIFKVVILPVCLLIGSNWGLIGIAWGVVVFSILGRLFNQMLLKIFFGFSILRFFKEASRPICMAMSLFIFNLLLNSIGFSFLMILFLLVTFYCLGSYFVWNKEVMLLFNKLKKTILSWSRLH
jgi:O-antigen/teichoic acid export membrane protein